MPITNDGIDFLIQAACGLLSPLIDSNNAYIGIGDGDAAFDDAQGDLQGANTKLVPMDSGFPIADPEGLGEANVVRFRGTFGENDANFDWKEWAVFNAETNGVMLNRVVDNQGTKASGATWRLTVDIELKRGV